MLKRTQNFFYLAILILATQVIRAKMYQMTNNYNKPINLYLDKTAYTIQPGRTTCDSKLSVKTITVSGDTNAKKVFNGLGNLSQHKAVVYKGPGNLVVDSLEKVTCPKSGHWTDEDVAWFSQHHSQTPLGKPVAKPTQSAAKKPARSGNEPATFTVQASEYLTPAQQQQRQQAYLAARNK